MRFCIIDDARSEQEYSVDVALEKTLSEAKKRVERDSGGAATIIAFIDTDSPDFDPTGIVPKEVFKVFEALAEVHDHSFMHAFDAALGLLMTSVLNAWRKYERENRDELLRVEQARAQLDCKL